MKSMIVALAFVAIVAALPVEKDPKDVPQITSYENEQKPDGGYKFGFKSSDNINRDEEADLKDGVNEKNEPVKILTVRGQYTYTNPNGEPEQIVYYADENGFHAEGKSIPVVPGTVA